MGRKLRPQHAGTFYVTTRSVAEETVFCDERDYLDGVQILSDLSADGLFACHAFCLMPTHYHLVASFEAGMLGVAIQRLNRRYAGGFNRRHRRHGHVFDSPFTSVEIVSDAHDRWLDHYIAENPPERPWPWSSYDASFAFVVPRPWRARRTSSTWATSRPRAASSTYR
jgi:REP element-mobilizing transposase RayT